MRILVNGEQVDVDTSNLREILVELGYQPEDIVVARNLEVIPRAQWDDCIVDEQDSLDVLAAMFGG
ncbi:MAG: sulfur carrier protein ThiS [Gammaproteobacteria bacterium]|nr:sulfur carrier protein ThiS [Gammaproteobacteria bacterium]MYF02510.1 sulfur carrier protein ThiS [Gammaproteobacteria bacterium]MYI78203.1 sulfur carrier protein ThiS [Gammaproteobacteria bacterium]